MSFFIAAILASQTPASKPLLEANVELLLLKQGTVVRMPKPENPIQTEGLPIILMGDEAMPRLKKSDQVASSPVIRTLLGAEAKMTTETDRKRESIRVLLQKFEGGRLLTRFDFERGAAKSSLEAWLEPSKTYATVVPADGGRSPILFRVSLVR